MVQSTMAQVTMRNISEASPGTAGPLVSAADDIKNPISLRSRPGTRDNPRWGERRRRQGLLLFLLDRGGLGDRHRVLLSAAALGR